MLNKSDQTYDQFTRFKGFKLLLGILGVLFFHPVSSFAQSDQSDACDEVAPFAENLFFNAEFQEAIDALQACLPAESLIDAQKAELYLLLARIYFAEQKDAPAAEALGHVFSLKPNYEPESYLPPPFIKFAESIREISHDEEQLDKVLVSLPPISEKKKDNKRWLLIGGGGLFAITAIAIMNNGGSDAPGGFPAPPGTPGNR